MTPKEIFETNDRGGVFARPADFALMRGLVSGVLALNALALDALAFDALALDALALDALALDALALDALALDALECCCEERSRESWVCGGAKWDCES